MPFAVVTTRVALALGVLAVVLAAQPAAGAGSASHFRQQGPGVQALFSTCPGGAVHGEPCTDTILTAGEMEVREDGSTRMDEFLFFEQTTQVCGEEEGIFVCRTLAHTTGFAGPGEVDLAVDERHLASASVRATPLAITCVPQGEEVECGEWHTVEVAAEWAATGRAERGAQNFHATTRCFVETFHVRGTVRPARAAGAIDAVDLGTSAHARISDAALITHTIRHTC